ncbi:MAG: hypothetical protein ACPGVT_11875, partial [Maricaulaceae bacterium]
MMNRLTDLPAREFKTHRDNQNELNQRPGRLRGRLLVSALSAAAFMMPATMAAAQQKSKNAKPLGSNAALDMTDTPRVGDTLTLTVRDADKSGLGSVTAEVENTTTGEKEIVTLVETSTKGVFTAQLPTKLCVTASRQDMSKNVSTNTRNKSASTTTTNCAGTDNDGMLSLKNGEGIRVKYVDELDSTGGTTERFKSTTVKETGSDATLELTENPKAGDALTLTVRDSDKIGLGSITAEVENTTTGEKETVTLFETSTKGVFTANLPTELCKAGSDTGMSKDATTGTKKKKVGTTTTSCSGTDNDGKLTVRGKDNIKLRYVDDLDSSGAPQSFQKTGKVASNTLTASADTLNKISGNVDNNKVANVLSNDTLNSDPIDPSLVTITLAPGSTLPSALTFDTATGNVGVKAGTPAGTYTFSYQICENADPTNCATQTVSITVTSAELEAVAESMTTIKGFEGGSSPHILTSDTMDGRNFSCAATGGTSTTASDRQKTSTNTSGKSIPGRDVSGSADCDEVTITVISIDSEIQYDAANGTITAPAGTPAGTYSLNYEICENLNPTNCSSAIETIMVLPAEIVASVERFDSIDGATGGTTDHLLASDRFNEMPFDCSGTVATGPKGNTLPGASCNDIVVTVTNSDAELTYNPSTGFISVAAGTPAGTYTLDYTICEVLNPSNCASATETVNVTASALSASNDTVTGVDGKTGNPSVTNVIDNDTLNGQSVDINAVTLSAATSVPSELTFDPSTGVVGVNPNTPSGVYTFE